MRRILFLWHSCDQGWLAAPASSPAGLHPPLLEKGYARVFKEGLWGETPLLELVQRFGGHPAFGGVLFSWWGGCYGAGQEPAVGWYPLNRGTIHCAVRTEPPAEALAAGCVEATRDICTLLRAGGREARVYLGLPAAGFAGLLPAVYQSALKAWFTGIDLDVARACSPVAAGVGVGGSVQLNPSSAMQAARWLRARFGESPVGLEPIDRVTPALFPWMTGEWGGVLAADPGGSWRLRGASAGWSNTACVGVNAGARLIIPGSLTAAQRVGVAKEAGSLGYDAVVEVSDLPLAVVGEMLDQAAGTAPAAQPLAARAGVAAELLAVDPALGMKLSGAWARKGALP